MITDTTFYYQIPLPHPNNLLQEDVLRLRTALNNTDGLLRSIQTMPIRVPFVKADGTPTSILCTNG